MKRATFCGVATAVVFLSLLTYGPTPAQQVKPVQITPLEAMQQLSQRGEYEKVRKIALADLWTDISKPETLKFLVIALEKLRDIDQAGAFCHILLRVLDEKPTASAPAAPALKKWAEAQLPRLDEEFNKLKKQYADGAAGRKFATPGTVSDLWMTQAQSDPQNLHALGAWKLVGGRKDAKPDWIHNLQGKMHRSCLKLMDEVDGRKGVLYAITVKLDAKDPKFLAAQMERFGRRPQIALRNVGKCKFLRAGVKTQNFPFILRVEAEGKELASQKVPADAWSDLKIDLGGSAGKDVPVIVELLVPEGQTPHEGGWIDYLDFFDD